jgi:hypothetical protein
VAAQYFGRNKVQYEKFDFRLLRSSHFDLYFYPAESLVVHDAARLAERWYSRHSDSFRTPSTGSRWSSTPTTRLPADERDRRGALGGHRGRHRGSAHPRHHADDRRLRDNDHVLGHELVHVFQYSVAEAGPGGLARSVPCPSG